MEACRTAILSPDLNSGLSGFWDYNKFCKITRDESHAIQHGINAVSVNQTRSNPERLPIIYKVQTIGGPPTWQPAFEWWHVAIQIITGQIDKRWGENKASWVRNKKQTTEKYGKYRGSSWVTKYRWRKSGWGRTIKSEGKWMKKIKTKHKDIKKPQRIS